MSKEYVWQMHSFVTISHPHGTEAMQQGWGGTHEIVLHTGTHVWVSGNYGYAEHEEIKQVGDGRDNGYDESGNCVLSVPASWCKFYTAKEAESIELCIDADERLLSYAR